jgi:hypothetical protein
VRSTGTIVWDLGKEAPQRFAEAFTSSKIYPNLQRASSFFCRENRSLNHRSLQGLISALGPIGDIPDPNIRIGRVTAAAPIDRSYFNMNG